MASIFFAPVSGLTQPDTLPAAPKKIKILSWNIYMLPAFLGHGQQPRAEAIGNLLATSDYDVIVFQEAFHSNARKTLSRLLSPAFPFQAGPANQKTISLKANSGIWILSKYPIRESHTIRFETRKGVDALARKGALLAEIMFQGQLIQVVGTHLQNEGGEWLRHSQCVELYNRLLQAHERPGVPQIICGDFNIDRNKSETSYHYMLNLLNATDGISTGSQVHTYDRLNNDLTTELGDERDLIDYVLTRRTTLSPGERLIRVFRHRWASNHKDLSDHFAIEAQVLIEPASGPLTSLLLK